MENIIFDDHHMDATILLQQKLCQFIIND